MIKKLPKNEDSLKEYIERIAKEIQKEEVSTITEEEQRKQQELIKENLHQLEAEIKKIINHLIEDIKSCDARKILDYFGALYGLTNPENILEDIDSEKNFKLDYIHSLVSAVGILNKKDCDETTLKRIEENIEKLTKLSIFYLMVTSDYKGMPNQTKFLQTIHHMIVRGDSYTEHKIEMCKELFSKFDDILIKKYDIDSKQLIDKLINIANSPIENEKQLKKNQLIESMIEETTKQEVILPSYLNIEEITSAWKQNFQKSIGSIFKIDKSLLPQKILDQLSMEVGENINFQKGRIEYFPMNETFIYDKPFIKIDDEYYCFNPALIIYNLHTILENIILDIIPPNKHQKNYYKKKGEYLEDKSLELFHNMLPNCEVYKGLKYGEEDEVDGIVIFDNNLFIIEAKSGKFSKGAAKGNVEKIKSDTKKLVEDAYNQAVRAKQYILSSDIVEFRDKNKRTVLTLKREKINNIYLINVTLEPLNHITTNLSSLKEFGFIQGNEWIWSIYLNDLRIITEILDSPSEFLLYLERRIKFNDYPQIRMLEEIDVFGYFLSEGLYFDDIKFPENGFMLNIDSSFSKDIDLYYLWKEGVLGKEVKKPSLFNKCKDNIKFLIHKIEQTNKECFTQLTTFLLNYDCHTQSFIKNEIDNILKSKRTDFHFYNEEKNIGVVFVSKKIYEYNRLQQRCELYAYERKINNWFVVIISNDFIDFKKFYFDNKPNKIIEEKLKGLKKYRVKQTLQVKRKIGRNEPCPCGSGKKYKKCCGR